MNLNEMSLDELRIVKTQLLAKCEGWKRCQDGSYEMALHYAGYDLVCKAIAEKEEK